MPPRQRINYDAIEPDWRAGLKSEEQLVREYMSATGEKVTRQGIKKHFEKRGIPRDLSARIKEKADAIVASSLVTDSVTPATKDRIVEANSIAVADVRLSHRADITRFKKIVLALLDELDEQTANSESFSALGEMLRAESESGLDKLKDIYHKVISTPGRIDGVKKLAEALRILITLEREAWSINNDTPAGNRTVSDLSADELIDIIKGAKD